MDKTRIDEANLFNEARQIPNPAEREELVARACGPDAELKNRVLKLLSEYYADPTYLSGSDSVGFVSPGHHLALAMIGTRIGPYELTSVLGEGGMGVVFLAEQRELIRRKVALKLIKPGMDSREILTRFSAERQALALMDHPYIARAFDVGTSPDGHPYFVMEYVDGVPITQYCSQKGLNTQERLELFRMTCEAVIHAHQKGVIHRDLKPTNILIAEQGGKALPKVIDFGVAKAINHPLTDQSILTGAGQLLGTLEYMSPEQMNFARQDVDTRTDVYAMGILLYELLTDLKPFDSKALRSAALDEVCRIIREQEPPRPSVRMTAEWKKTDSGQSTEGRPAAFRRLPDDLDWIVMKAIEKDRSRRYDGIGAFAADIDHFLNQEPVSAGPPSKLYRLRKAARRNRGALAAAALILIVLISATVVSLRQAFHATRALAVADSESERARKSEDTLRRTMYAADM